MICDSFTNSYSKAFISISYQTVLVKLLLQQVFYNLMYLLSPFQINFIVFTEDGYITKCVQRKEWRFSKKIGLKIPISIPIKEQIKVSEEKKKLQSEKVQK